MARARWQFDAPSLRRSAASRPPVADSADRPLIRMQALGGVTVLIGEHRLDSSSDTLFALLVRTVYNGSCTVGRDVLLRSLWPSQPDTRQRANLRQALYKLRLLGVRIGLQGDEVALDPSQLVAVFAVQRTAARFEEDVTRGDEPFGLFLPGYHTGWPEYDEWLVMQREAVHADVRRVLVGQLAMRRERADWAGADAVARWLLQFDPLNEEATLTVAECLARNGSKVDAVALIDRYIEDLGADASELRLPATLLRRRITEPHRNGRQRISLAPTDRHFVGRDVLMTDLTLAMRRSKWGEGSALLLHAAPGMGKTRVTHELAKSAAIEGHRVITIECRESDVHRPLSMFLSLVPELLDLPGAMACDPDRLRVLRRLASQDTTANDDARDAKSAVAAVERADPSAAPMPLPLPSVLRRCIVELLVNVCYERATVLVADNMQWADELSASVLADIATASRDAKLFVLATSRSASADPVKRMLAGGMEARALAPLSDDAAQQLAGLICDDTGMSCSSELQAWFVRASEGTPLFLRGLLHHWVDTGAAGGIPPTLAALLAERISALSEDALRTMQVASVLGRHATMQTIAEVLELPVMRMIAALEELGDAGAYAPGDSGIVVFHELISKLALRRLSLTSRQLISLATSKVLRQVRFADEDVAVDVVEHLKYAGSKSEMRKFACDAAASYLIRGAPHRALAVCEAANVSEHFSDDFDSLELIELRALHEAGQHLKLLQRFSTKLANSTLDPSWDEGHIPEVLSFMDAVRHSPVVGDCKELLARALLMANSPRVCINDRLAICNAALRLAATIDDKDAAEKAYHAGSCCAEAVDIGVSAQHELDMFYHTYFGSAVIARKSAAWLANSLSQYRDQTERWIRSAHLIFALRLNGDPEAAYQLCEQCFGRCISEQAHFAAASIAWNASLIALDHFEDLSLAQQWLSHGALNAPEVVNHQIGIVLQENRVRVAIVQKDVDGARLALAHIPEQNVDFSLPFRSAYFLAMQLGVATLGKSQIEIEPLLHRALQTYAKTKEMPGQDFLVSQLVTALASVGLAEKGEALCDEYLTSHRRLGTQVPQYLRRLTRE